MPALDEEANEDGDEVCSRLRPIAFCIEVRAGVFNR